MEKKPYLSTDLKGIRKKLINSVWKCLPLREENKDYLQQINKVISEVKSMRKVIDCELFFTTEYRLQMLKEVKDFSTYRKIVLKIVNDLDKEW